MLGTDAERQVAERPATGFSGSGIFAPLWLTKVAPGAVTSSWPRRKFIEGEPMKLATNMLVGWS